MAEPASGARGWWRRHLVDARHVVPDEDRGRPLRRRILVVRTALLLGTFELNGRLIRRYGGDLPAVWDPTAFGWTADFEAAHGEIRAEIERYLQGHSSPHVAEIAGLTPDSAEALLAAPVDRGSWRTLMLVANGRLVEETARWFPVTVGMLARCPRTSTVGFSTLAGRSHIAEHADRNHGALRYQLPLVVDGRPGDCRIQVGDEAVTWEEGRSILFDVSVRHEVWNDAEGDRIGLLVEIPMPLRPVLSGCNRAVQWLQRFHPSHQHMATRVTLLAGR